MLNSPGDDAALDPTPPHASIWRRVLAWLRRVPITDPVDRRNAPALQMLFLYLGTEIPLNRAYHLLTSTSTMSAAQMAVDLGTDLAISVAAWIGVWMIRRGRLQAGVSMFVAVLMLCAVAANIAFGYMLQAFDPYPMLMLTLAGLVIGRPAMWAVYVCIPLIFAIGMHSSLGRGEFRDFNPFYNLPSLALSYLMIALVLDRTVAALRESLLEARRNAERLQEEMRERERVQERLLHMQKIESVGQLASGVSHDFNNILGAIIGYTAERHRIDELDFDPAVDAPAMADALEGIALAAQRGVAVSRKLLSFSRRELAVPRRVDAGHALQGVTPMLRQLFDRSVTLRIDVPAQPVWVHLDRSQLDLTLLNFAANARDAMPDGGEFSIRLAVDAAAVRAVIHIADTGAGMAQDVVDRAFEPFFTTKPAGLGTGLGLSVAHELAQQAGGELAVRSVVGAGTCFTLTLPLHMSPATG